MLKLKHVITSSILATTLLSPNISSAKNWYPGQAPTSYHMGGLATGANMVGCTSCHAGLPYTENNITKSFGVAFARISDDDNAGTLVTAYNTLATQDSDGDGFSNQQEAFFGSDFNTKAITPFLSTADMNITTVAAQSTTGGPVNMLTLQAGVPTTALGGTVSFSSPYNNINPTLTTTNFIFQDGGIQTGATIAFYDKNNVPITSTITTDSGFIVNANGTADVTVKDEGVFDLYSTTIFRNDAKSRTITFTPITSGASISPYATVDAYAKISPLATIEPYANISAYAIVDAYAVIGAYAQIGSYAYIAPNIDIYTGIDIYTKVTVDAYATVTTNVISPTTITEKTGIGYVSAKFAVTTTAPVLNIQGTSLADNNIDGGSDSTGGLHCMTTGLGTPALMFLGLFIAGYFIRRKRS
ncbi:MAG: hypothetical protein Q9N62_01920 [Ghiorsea sp.]|nr:hypothetical protein [Ghiorsea sp.]